MTKDIDCEYTKNITCPYCGDENIDSWEVGEDIYEGSLGKQICGNCDKEFIVRRDCDVTYVSEKIEDQLE